VGCTEERDRQPVCLSSCEYCAFIEHAQHWRSGGKECTVPLELMHSQVHISFDTCMYESSHSNWRKKLWKCFISV
jgi:hypothetical protein